MPRLTKRKRAILASAKKGWEAVREKTRKKEAKLERALARLQNLPPPREDTFLGRRLVASKSILDLVGSLTKHGRECNRARMRMKEEEINGVSSTITFVCVRCKWEVSAGSDFGEEKCSLNEALQWATVNIPVSFEDASSLFSCVDLPFSSEWFVKQEPELDDHNEEDSLKEVALSNYSEVETSQVIGIRRCLICDKNAPNAGLNTNGILEKGNTAAFLLGTMLQIPPDKLQEFRRDKVTIFCCDSCSESVQNAFIIQKKLEALAESLANLKKQVQTAICMSWKLDKGVKGQKNFVSKDSHEIMAVSVRRYVATGDWDNCAKDELTAETSCATIVYKQEAEPDMEDHFSDTNLMEYPDIEFDREAVSDPGPTISGETKEQIVGDVISETSDSIGKYSCKMCPDMDSMNVKSFVHHILYHKRRPFQCTVCKNYLTGNPLEFDAQPAKLANSSIEPSLKDHLCSSKTIVKVNLQTLPIWSCEHCSELFDIEENRDSHETTCPNKSTTPPRIHTCVTCKREFRTRNEWQIHRALNHPEVARFACHFCDALFKVEASRGITDKFVLDRTAFMEHSNVCSSKHDLYNDFSHQSYILRECEFCGKNFTRQLELERHVEKRHFVSKNSANCCPLCFHRRRRWNDLRSHMRSHMGPGSFTCDQCGQSVTRHTRLLEHCLRVHGVKTEASHLKKCNHEGCTFETFYASTLTRHQMTTHGVERQHKCQFCEKGFLTLKHKQEHEMIHTNKQSKPYQCEICGNSFALRNYLYIHMRLSHQNRPFASTHKKKPPQQKSRKTEKSHQKNLPSPSGTRNGCE